MPAAVRAARAETEAGQRAAVTVTCPATCVRPVVWSTQAIAMRPGDSVPIQVMRLCGGVEPRHRTLSHGAAQAGRPRAIAARRSASVRPSCSSPTRNSKPCGPVATVSTDTGPAGPLRTYGSRHVEPS